MLETIPKLYFHPSNYGRSLYAKATMQHGAIILIIVQNDNIFIVEGLTIFE